MRGERLTRLRPGFGIGAGPLAWSVQLLVGYGLTAYACHPGGLALAEVAEGWGWTRGAALALNLLAALVALAGGVVSLSAWRAAPRHAADPSEGRRRFLAAWGVLTSFGFLLVILFNTVMVVGAPACHG